MANARMTEIPTIDVVRVEISVDGNANTLNLDTSTKVAVEPQIETTDGTKLIVKGILRAQKPSNSVITGHKITLTDNVFTPELVQILQGGEVTKSPEGAITGYTPPISGVPTNIESFSLTLYSAQYNAAGQIINYEKTVYPNCKGQPFAPSTEDNVFRVSEYVIDSAPNKGQAPYTITYVNTLPALT